LVITYLSPSRSAAVILRADVSLLDEQIGVLTPLRAHTSRQLPKFPGAHPM
jgi:hypothetical protein